MNDLIAGLQTEVSEEIVVSQTREGLVKLRDHIKENLHSVASLTAANERSRCGEKIPQFREVAPAVLFSRIADLEVLLDEAYACSESSTCCAEIANDKLKGRLKFYFDRLRKNSDAPRPLMTNPESFEIVSARVASIIDNYKERGMFVSKSAEKEEAEAALSDAIVYSASSEEGDRAEGLEDEADTKEVVNDSVSESESDVVEEMEEGIEEQAAEKSTRKRKITIGYSSSGSGVDSKEVVDLVSSEDDAGNEEL